MKTRMKILAMLAAAVGLCSAAFAGEGTVLRSGGGRPRIGQAPGGRHCPPRRHRRMRALRRLLNTEEGKALREEFQDKMKALGEERKKLREKIRAEIQGGKKPQDVLPQYEDDFKALLKKRILLGIEFRKKLLDLAEKNVDEAVEKLHQRLRKRIAERRRSGGGFGGFRRRRLLDPEAGDE